MTDRPIIFSGPMVKQLLAGNKTQTRRVLNPQPIGTPWFWEGDEVDPKPTWFDGYESGREPCGAATREVNNQMKVRYAVGDRLYVREAFTTTQREIPIEGTNFFRRQEEPMYAADYIGFDKPDRDWNWASPIHMPRRLSRITLTVTDVRVQRLNDISEEDAVAEGAEPELVPPDGGSAPHVEGFRLLWESLHGPGSWTDNPWVVAVSFTVEQRNIDAGEG